MNALTYAINNLNFVIPKEVLEITFKAPTPHFNNSLSLEEKMMATVIRPRILTDTNIVGGVQVVIDLSRCEVTMYNNTTYVVNVPKALTNNRSIISLLSVVTMTTPMGNSALYSTVNNSMLGNMQNNISSVDITQTTRLEMIGDNVFIIETSQPYLTNAMLRCNIENASNMENINPRNFTVFAKLVELGVKSYIRNNNIVKIDKGFIYGGHELSIIKDIIDEYSDAEEMYQELLNGKWKKVSFMNNKEAMHRHVRSMLGNNL